LLAGGYTVVSTSSSATRPRKGFAGARFVGAVDLSRRETNNLLLGHRLGEDRMRRLVFLVAVMTLVAAPAPAQKSAVNFKFDFGTVVTCREPVNLTNSSSRGNGSGVLNSNGSASFDLSLATSTIHFDAKLGGGSSSAPFGATRLNVVNQHQLRAVWSLPNNDIIMNLSVNSDSCQATAVSQLRRGAKEHNSVIFGKLAYCSKLQITGVHCTVQ
jgi:hypothetical protein